VKVATACQVVADTCTSAGCPATSKDIETWRRKWLPEQGSAVQEHYQRQLKVIPTWLPPGGLSATLQERALDYLYRRVSDYN
jgi:hypothetical protein